MNNNRPHTEAHRSYPKPRSLFVSNVPRGATRSFLVDEFGSYGEIARVHVIERNGKPTIGFVNYSRQEDAIKAIDHFEKRLRRKETALIVRFANDKKRDHPLHNKKIDSNANRRESNEKSTRPEKRKADRRGLFENSGNKKNTPKSNTNGGLKNVRHKQDGMTAKLRNLHITRDRMIGAMADYVQADIHNSLAFSNGPWKKTHRGIRGGKR